VPSLRAFGGHAGDSDATLAVTVRAWRQAAPAPPSSAQHRRDQAL